ncbi:multimeric translocon complex in the outer envelope membrane 132 [Actinidia rufa]|uniref:Multimeric translocon complex in the outer envelope membrane 132 n=1 Tax=Actinidia rufa TaxID=165716 RepID=A0A7J0DA32_9ERIC|nr:multimeric translocon complex in the outer envelope membrane 132 [Actinidia rufa]
MGSGRLGLLTGLISGRKVTENESLSVDANVAVSRDDNAEKVGDLCGSVDVDENSYVGSELEKFEVTTGVPVVADKHEDKLPVGFEDNVEGEVTGKLVDGVVVDEVIDEESVAEKDLRDGLDRMENDVAWEASNITASGGKEDLKNGDETDQKLGEISEKCENSTSDIVNLEERPVNGHANKEAIQVDKESETGDSQIVQGGDSDSQQEASANQKKMRGAQLQQADKDLLKLPMSQPRSLKTKGAKDEEVPTPSPARPAGLGQCCPQLEPVPECAASSDEWKHILRCKTNHIRTQQMEKSEEHDEDLSCMAKHKCEGETMGGVGAFSFDRPPQSQWRRKLEAAGQDTSRFLLHNYVLWKNRGCCQTDPAGIEVRAPPEVPLMALHELYMFVTQRSHVVQPAILAGGWGYGLMILLRESTLLAEQTRAVCRTAIRMGGGMPNFFICSWSTGNAFATRIRASPLPLLPSTLLQSRPQLKLPEEQFGDGDGLDDDLDESSDSNNELEYDKLPPFKRLMNDQLATLSRAQKEAYFDELEFRENLFMKKQLKEEKKRWKMMNEHAALAKDLPSSYSENLEEEFQFPSRGIVRPVLDTHGWDHDLGGNVERRGSSSGSFTDNFWAVSWIGMEILLLEEICSPRFLLDGNTNMIARASLSNSSPVMKIRLCMLQQPRVERYEGLPDKLEKLNERARNYTINISHWIVAINNGYHKLVSEKVANKNLYVHHTRGMRSDTSIRWKDSIVASRKNGGCYFAM